MSELVLRIESLGSQWRLVNESTASIRVGTRTFVLEQSLWFMKAHEERMALQTSDRFPLLERIDTLEKALMDSYLQRDMLRDQIASLKGQPHGNTLRADSAHVSPVPEVPAAPGNDSV